MGSIFSRVKTWVSTEDVTAADLNAEFDNILDNLVPLQLDDYSVNTAQMQVTTNPGLVGTESLATTLAGELERLRYTINAIKGTTEWYEAPATSIADLNNAVGTALFPNRIVSGDQLSGTEQPIALDPAGSATTVTLRSTVNDFVYVVEGVSYTMDSTVTLTGLSTASGDGTTDVATIDDPSAADGNETRYLGSYGTEIHLDSVGSEITALVGKLAGFKLTTGAGSEYFVGRVKDAATLVECQRGYFFDSSQAHIPAIVFADNDTVTLMKLGWIFLHNNETMQVTYNEPTYSVNQPAGPAIGDYWYDYAADKWKWYTGTVWSDGSNTLIGCVIIDSTNCVAARTFDYFKSYDDLNTLELVWESNTEIRSRNIGAAISVNGNKFVYDHDNVVWDITLDLESGESETNSTYYYLYITEANDVKMSTIPPLEQYGNRRGFYHPKNTWRCVGKCFNDASGHLDPLKIVSTRHTNEQSLFSNNTDIVGTVYQRFSDDVQEGELQITGTQTLSRYLYAELFDHLGTNVGEGDAADTFHLPDMDGRFIRITDNAAGRDPNAGARTAMNTNGNTGDNVGSIQGQFTKLPTTAFTTNTTGAHTHNLTEPGGGAADYNLFAGNIGAAHATSSAGNHSHTISGGDAETRPINVNMNLFMKVSR